MAEVANSEAGFTMDPGIRLLTKIGDFVEPLTRFDRGHLTLETSQHLNVDVIARQAFRLTFDVSRSEANGPLPAGVTQVADAAAVTRESEAQLAASRAVAQTRLADWAATHGENPKARPAVGDCFTQPPAVGHVETCQPCAGRGKIDCPVCAAAGTLTCEACAGRGSNPCETCNATGQTTCGTCKGMRTVVTLKQRKVVDQATGETHTEHVQETVQCGTCAGAGVVKCARCGGRTEITCATCRGQKTIPCTQCKGAGFETCQACGGHGERHFMAQLSCTIRETFEVTSRAPDAETTSVLKSLRDIEQVLALAGSHRSISEITADTLRRDTTAVTPVTTVVVQAGGMRAEVRGYGPQQDVRDYRNIAGMLLSDDLRLLEEALPSTSLIPPKVNSGLDEALSIMLASEVNVTIAESAAKKDTTAVEQTFLGVATGDYIRRAGVALKTAIRREYWAELLRWPAAVLAIPLIQMPIELIVRGQGQGARMMALIGVMLVTFFAALAAHYWCLQKLQQRIRPEGVPKISRLADKLNLTRDWLLAASAAAVILTMIVASLTSALFPPQPVLVLPFPT